MSSKISDYVFNLRNRFSQKAGSSATRATSNYQDAKNIGILFKIEDDEKHDALNAFVKTLQSEGKNLTLLTYFERLENNPYNFRYEFFSKKDITTLGKIKSRPVQNFIETPFDYLYCVTVNHFLPFDSILLKSQAKCRIGRYFPEQESCFELMLDLKETNGVDELIQQMLHYTKKLTKN
ncbi:hypothetical protein BKI52_36130 [marine bacterium AO1-C]|nr:hypothetical protein BKI52_36130 [marine bacterium AO1-C]